jgi:hypothetical protein
MHLKRIKVDEQSSFLLLSMLLSLLLFPNGFYLFFPVLILYFLLYQMQQPYKPAIFTVLILQHFLQIATAVWLCNYLGKEIDYNTSNRSTAIVACSVGLVALMLPVLYVQNRLPQQSRTSLRNYSTTFSTEKVMYAYIISFFIASFLGSIAFVFGGFTQIIISVVKVKWVLFLLFGYQCLLKNEYKKMFYLAVCLEFLSGFLGFFSDFKTVIYFLIALIIPLYEKLDFRQVISFLLLGLILGFFGLTWTTIKSDYRSYLNGGEKSQTVKADVTTSSSLNKLYDLSSNVDGDKLNQSIVDLLDRLQYTFHFAKTIDRVPNILPHENGANWLSNLEFTTTPRFLNPNKPTFDATEKTKKYTGIRYAGRNEGASFSLGYFPECYIDFGMYGMMLMLAAIGGLYAVLYNYLLKKSSNNPLFNYAVVGAFFLEFAHLEMDGTYLLGRLFSSVVTFYFVRIFLFPFLLRFITISEKKEESSYSIYT